MKKIVCIDDELAVLAYLKNALDEKGYQTFVTGQIEEFFTLMKKHSVALILLDIRMPEKSGFDVFKEIRKLQHTPALFVTAYAGSFSAQSQALVEMWKNEFSDGVTDILYKPFSLETLYEKVESLIGPADEDA